MENKKEHIIPMDQWTIYKFSQRQPEVIRQLNEFTFRKLKQNENSTLELLEKTIYLEKIRTRNNPWKVDPADDKSFWIDMDNEVKKRKKRGVQEYDDLLKRIIHRYNQEIVGNFKLKTFKFARIFLAFLFKRLLTKGLFDFSGKKKLYKALQAVGKVEEFRNLHDKGTIIILPTHFSNLDSILIGYILDLIVKVPAYSYGAGLNLFDNEIVAYFINRLGAYRVDRRKKNPIYLECLKGMTNYSAQEGLNQIFFPGGTRSRNGKLEEKVKLGLLGSVVEAQRDALEHHSNRKIFLVPLVLNYHFVLEANPLINQYLRRTAREKYIRPPKEGKFFNNLWSFISALFTKESEIIISFGDPMDVFGNRIDQDGKSIGKNGEEIDIRKYFETDGKIEKDPQREKVYTKHLGEQVVNSFLKSNYVLSSHLVAFAAFRFFLHGHPDLNEFDVINLPTESLVIHREVFEQLIKKFQSELKKMEQKNQLMLSPAVKASFNECITDGLKNIGIYHPRKVLTFNDNDLLVSEDMRLLYYYHNRLDSYGLEKLIPWEKFLQKQYQLTKNFEQ